MTAQQRKSQTHEDVPPTKSLKREIIEWVAYLSVSVILALLIVNFLGRFTVVEGNSMQPTLQNKDIVIVEKLSLRLKGVQDSDIVVVKIPELLGTNRTYAIKRVIAKTGQHVRIAEGVVFVDGLALDEPYVNSIPTESMDSPYADMDVPEGCIYLLGDNRNPNKSRDSRVFGVVNEERIIGKAFVRLFPFSRMGRVR